MNAMEITGVSKHYPAFTLGPVSLTLPAGCIMGLVGENGAGKTTLIRLIMGATGADGGLVSVLGVDNHAPEFREIKEDVGVVPDEPYCPDHLTALDLGRIMEATYQRWDEQDFRRRLAAFELPEKQKLRTFSRGMKMKLAIAAAMSHAPKLLILDEATSGLDPVVRDEILSVFIDFAREDDHAVLMSSHIVSDLEKACDYIACLRRGRLLLCEEKDRLLEEYAVVKLTSEDFARVPSAAVHGKRVTPYCVEALVRREALPPTVRAEHATLEDVLLFLIKEEK